MTMFEVQSSWIESVGYDDKCLFIKTQSGQTYKYKRVPQILFIELIKSSSKGHFICSQIKPYFDYEEV